MDRRQEDGTVILQLPAGSPGWMFAAADSLLALHIGGGLVGIVSGGTALLARKGEPLHRLSGDIFLGAMLVMSAIGAAVAPFLPQKPSVIAGLLTFYLVATGWMTVRRPESRIGRFEFGGFVAALCIAALGLGFIRLAAISPSGLLDGEPRQPLYAFVLVATIAAASDLKLILRGGITGVQRIARHLWRMCLALFIAAASFFLGQQKIMPAFLQGSPLLFIPAFAPLVLMGFWLARVRLPNMFRASGNRPIGMDNRVEAA
jgi:uncharacterized membrane protein